jgi:hypothetical protein
MIEAGAGQIETLEEGRNPDPLFSNAPFFQPDILTITFDS